MDTKHIEKLCKSKEIMKEMKRKRSMIVILPLVL
jgi:hypothetical protein